MLLSKPKKCYKSVSKTDLMSDQEKGEKEEEQKVDIFDYEEMNITQDKVQSNYFLISACLCPGRIFCGSFEEILRLYGDFGEILPAN